MERMSKDRYYLNLAYNIAMRSTCLRRCYGVVIVKNDEIISTGYNGAPRGCINCSDRGICRREELNVQQGHGYAEYCKSVHAEQNAIISAKRSDLIDSTLYLAGYAGKLTKKENSTLDMKKIFAEPCSMCKRFILNAGIKYVICDNLILLNTNEFLKVVDNGKILITDTKSYIKELDKFGEDN